MNNCLMSRLYMQSSAFAWLFFLYCKILLIPLNRINRENTEAKHMCGIYTTTRWLWSASWKQCQIFKLLHFPTDSNSNHLSWLLPFCVQLLDTGHSPPYTKGFLHLKNVGVVAYINTEMTRVCEWIILQFDSRSQANGALCMERSQKRKTLRKKKVYGQGRKNTEPASKIFAKDRHGHHLPKLLIEI